MDCEGSEVPALDPEEFPLHPQTISRQANRCVHESQTNCISIRFWQMQDSGIRRWQRFSIGEFHGKQAHVGTAPRHVKFGGVDFGVGGVVKRVVRRSEGTNLDSADLADRRT